MHNAVGIQKDPLTLSRGIWVSSTRDATIEQLGSPGEEAGEHAVQREK